MSEYFLGLGKTLFNSSSCVIKLTDDEIEIHHSLNERLTRVKANGSWPVTPLKKSLEVAGPTKLNIAENRDVELPSRVEEAYDLNFPFFDHLKKKQLENYTTKYNKDIKVIPHHLAHAYAALAVSPYEKSIIVVIDGAGSRYSDFSNHWKEKFEPKVSNSNEAYTIYTQNRSTLTEIEKKWQTFKKSKNNQEHYFSEGLGTLYEKVAEYIFNSKRAAGKVMGLAAFGRPFEIQNSLDFLEGLDWDKSYTGKSKAEWESSPHMNLYQDIAASVQQYFERYMNKLVSRMAKEYPDYRNIIITGGCALNCSSNMKLVQSNLFDSIYIPPFPGDECIGLGAAYHQLINHSSFSWKPTSPEKQHGYFGTSDSESESIEEVFRGFNVFRPECISTYTAEQIADNKIIAWFQGRSESGPRALGNRSILARIDKKGLKDHLNRHIKFRESFRPYGCSCAYEESSQFFDIPDNFDNPFMSFATPIKSDYSEIFREVSHLDGTSRMQTVRKGQNTLFHDLLLKVGKLTGLPCVLNTSLNIMGDPIVESLEDARDFLLKSNVDGLAIGEYFVTKL